MLLATDLITRGLPTEPSSLTPALGSSSTAISADGQYVAFVSEAGSLVGEHDIHDGPDVFVRDRTSGVTTRVSVNPDPHFGSSSWDPAISAEGRYVAFVNNGAHLVTGDTNGAADVFVYDRDTGATSRVSVASDGTEANGSSQKPAVSADGRYVAFASQGTNLVPGDTNGWSDIFVHDRATGTTSRVSVASDGSEGNMDSYDLAISADGQYVAFTSGADNLVPNDGNGMPDIFMHDRVTGLTTRVSIASDGTEANAWVSGDLAISANGRYVAFESWASNLVTGDTNGVPDIFVHDGLTGETTRVSVAAGGAEGNSASFEPTISADGRYIAFTSSADNLLANDTNGVDDVFVHDQLAGLTSRVSIASDGAEVYASSYDPAISADGLVVAFTSYSDILINGDNNGAEDVFVHDRDTGATVAVSVVYIAPITYGNDVSDKSAISASGRYVAFEGWASNLVPGDTNGVPDIFVHDRVTGIITRISVASDGTQANVHSYYPVISADGRYVAFESSASNLVPDDTNGMSDIFVHDRETGVTTRVSVASDGSQANSHSQYARISGDGRFVSFSSGASNLVPQDSNGWTDIFVHDRETGVTSRVSVASDGSQSNGYSYVSAISGDGRYVAFDAGASNLVPDDTNGMSDVFLHDRETGVTTRLSIATDGTQANFLSWGCAISSDGRSVTFTSAASNLVPQDTDVWSDIFVHDHETGTTSRLSVASDGTPGNNNSEWPTVSSDGRYVSFTSEASNLVPGDTNSWGDIFVHDRVMGVTTRVSVASNGSQANGYSVFPAISANGQRVSFSSVAYNLATGLPMSAPPQVYVVDLVPPASSDPDGVIDEVEDAAPNDGDGNADGIADSQQSEVTSLPNSQDQQFVTLVSPTGTNLVEVAATSNPSPADSPAGVEFPIGHFTFAVASIAAGGATTVTLYLPDDTLVDSYYKYGPTPANSTPHWYDFQFDGATGAEIFAEPDADPDPEIIVLHFVDGQRGDDDLLANGQVRDPGSPAFRLSGVSTVDGVMSVRGAAGEDIVFVSGGNLVVNGIPYSLAGVFEVRIWGRDGDDQINLSGTSVSSFIDGGNGNDELHAGNSDSVLWGGPGDDQLFGGNGNDTLGGGDDNDELRGRAGDDQIHGDEGDDDLVGDEGNDVLEGNDGSDSLRGGQGDDLLGGGKGNDLLKGGLGTDELSGGDGDDDLQGEQGDDVLDGGNGNDTLAGGQGTDELSGGRGDDMLRGEQGDDVLDGGDDNDRLLGGLGNDRLLGEDGNDLLGGDQGDDVLIGGDGDDMLDGDAGSDLLIGGRGQDDLDGGQEGDLLIAGHTVFDGNLVAIDSILAEWRSSRGFLVRVQNLRNGTGSANRLNGSYFLQSGVTVFDDSIGDMLTGDGGRDWFFADSDAQDGDDDLIIDKANDELLDLLLA